VLFLLSDVILRICFYHTLLQLDFTRPTRLTIYLSSSGMSLCGQCSLLHTFIYCFLTANITRSFLQEEQYRYLNLNSDL